MKIKVDSQIRISDATKEIKSYIKQNLEITNPEIQKKQAMGFWAGNIPRKIKMYSKNGNDFILPLGTIDDIWKINNNINDYSICFGKHEKLQFPENDLELYDYQKNAVEAMIKAKRGILESKCGSGKSIMGLEIIKRIGYKALIIVQTKEIADQFIDYLKNTFNMSKGEYGLIAAGKVEIGSLVTVALRQTLVKTDLTQYKYEWGTIIVDEVQNVGGSVTKVTQYQKILSNLASEYRIGLSATGYRVDGLTKCLYAIMNTIKYRIPDEAIANKTMKAKIIPVRTAYEIPRECQKFDGTILYSNLSTNLSENDSRNDLIAKLLKENESNFCLILSDRLAGLKQLHKRIGGLIIDGSMTSKSAKKEREDAIQKMRDKKEHFLFATYNLAREGLDIKPLNRLFLIAPTKNKITLIQSVGRIERKDDNKIQPIVYDFIDKDVYFEKAWRARKTIYRKNDNEILDK